MPDPTTEDADIVPLDPRQRALRHLRKVRDFKRHLTAYILFNGIIVVIWLVTGPANDSWFPWFLFPMLGWGVGIVFHAMDVYGGDITEDDIAQEIRREQGEQYPKAS